MTRAGRRFAIGCVGGLAWLAVSPARAASLPPPADVTAVPRYGNPDQTIVRWTAVADASYQVQKQVVVETAAWTTVLDQTDEMSFEDPAPPPDDQQLRRYRVRSLRHGDNPAVLPNSNGDWQESNWMTVRLRWPPLGNGEIEILHNYGTMHMSRNGSQAVPHDGLDLLGQNGTEVRAVRGGIIKHCNNAANGSTFVEVEDSSGKVKEVYEHVEPAYTCQNLPDGTAIPPGRLLGTIRFNQNTGFPDAAYFHLHYEHQFERLTATEIERTKNPLLSLPAVEADPHSQQPSFKVIDSGRRLLVVKSDGGLLNTCRADEALMLCPAYENTLPYATGDVDLIVGAFDLMATQSTFLSAPFSMKAWIETPDGTDVAGSESQPMSLSVFDDERINWKEGCRVTWKHQDPLAPNEHRWRTYTGWIVTNSSCDGKVDYCRFWRTSAKSVVDASADGAGDPIASDIAGARFPDGTYVLQVVLSDLASTASDKFDVIVDNFAPRLSSVELLEGGQLLQRQSWGWKATTGRLRRTVTGVRPLSRGSYGQLTLAVTFSEPVHDVKICMTFDAAVCASPWIALQPTPLANTASLQWSFTVPGVSISMPGKYRLFLAARDQVDKGLQPPSGANAPAALVFEVAP